MALEDLISQGNAESPFATDSSAGEPVDKEDLDQESDRGYFSSFGKGTFSPNQYGGLSFTPADQGATADSSRAPSPASIDPNTMMPRRYPQASQIHSLDQLAQVAARLRGVPSALSQRILARLLGYSDNQDPNNRLAQNFANLRMKALLDQPYKQARLNQTQAGLDLRQQSARLKAQDMADKNKRAQQTLDFRRENAKSMRELHHMTALSTLTNRIGQLTKAAELTGDEKAKANILQHVAKLHKLASQYEKMFLPDEEEGNGGGGNDSESTASGDSY